MSKYRNKRINVNGIWFDSTREANRYGELKMLERAEEISCLRLQVPYTLAPEVVINGKKKRALTYVADFVYADKYGDVITEDCKGFKTDVYKIKRHLMKSVLGIDIKET